MTTATEGTRWLTVVGVVRDARQALREPSPKMVYQPLEQSLEPPEALTAVVRTTGDPTALAAFVSQEVRALSPDVAVMWVRTMRQQIAAATTRERLLSTLSTAFALLALLLACIGLYGVISYSVTQQTYEFGLRMALGAQKKDVLRMVLRHGIVLTASGLFIGVVGALVLGRLVETLLFQTSASDPPTLVIVASILVSIALLASYLPARRAASVDPLTSLHYE